MNLASYIRDVPDFPLTGILTGGTARAVVDLVQQLGGELVGVQFLVELAGLGGRGLLEGTRCGR
jgi:adenine/guanine phosphoribosyltransferase-like PRPP-binding protein